MLFSHSRSEAETGRRCDQINTDRRGLVRAALQPHGLGKCLEPCDPGSRRFARQDRGEGSE